MNPKNILFVCDSMPLSENFSGAASLKYSHLKLLLACFPNTVLKIIILKYYDEDNFQAEELKQDFPEENYTTEIIDLRKNRNSGLRRKLYGFLMNHHAIRYFHDFINSKNIADFQQTVAQFDPDLIWTENYIENYFALSLHTNVPIVYSHYDFLWKLMNLKHKSQDFRKRIINFVRKKSEISQIKKNLNLVSGSQSEKTELEWINTSAQTVLLPTTYHSQNVPDSVPLDTRIVHVGTLLATANKVGLQRFLTVCWPLLLQLPNPPELWVIGNVHTGQADEVVTLLEQPNIRVLGHVADLSTVLRPYDIHIIPYEHDTGTRTRIPMVLNYKQLLVSTRKASNGVAGLKDQENCLLVDSLEEMNEKIRAVLSNKQVYQPIAENGKMLYEKSMTYISQKKRLIEFIENTKRPL